MRTRQGIGLVGQPSAKGCNCFSVGGAVTRLTTKRHKSDASKAGRIASREAIDSGRYVRTNWLSQKTVTKVPAPILATAAAPVARRQKNAARMTGVSAAE